MSPSRRTVEAAQVIADALASAGYALHPVVAIPAGRDCLAGMRLCPLERAILAVLMNAAPRRLTMAAMIEPIEDILQDNVAEGPLRAVLCRMTHRDVGILDASRGARGGYQITADFAAEMAMRANLCA